MDSSEVPAPQKKSYKHLVCDVCDFKCNVWKIFQDHFYEKVHLKAATSLAERLFGFTLNRPGRCCLDDLFRDPRRNSAFIGGHYVEFQKPRGGNWVFVCTLCDVEGDTMFEHIISISHRRNYIAKEFSFLFSDVESISPEVIEMIARIIERVEGPRKFSFERVNLTKRYFASDCSSLNIDKIVEQLKRREIPFKKPRKKYNKTSWATESPPFTRPDDSGNRRSRTHGVFKQRKLEQPTQPAGITSKKPFRKENDESSLVTEAFPSTINENRGNRRFTPKKAPKKQKSEQPTQSAGIASKRPFRNDASCLATEAFPSTINENRGNRRFTPKKAPKKRKSEQPTQSAGIASKRPFRNDESCLATEAFPSTINENSGTRWFTPKKAPLKSELPTQPVGQPIMSLARPVPVPFCFSDQYICVPAAKNLNSYNSQQATKLPTTSDIPIQDIESNPIPSLISTHRGSLASQTTEWFYRTAEHGYDYYTNPSRCGFANNSAHGQASSVSDVGKEYAFEGPTWGQETGHPGAQHLHTLETTSSVTGPTSSVPSLKQHTTSRYGYSSVDIKELPSKSCSPLGFTSVLNKEPSLPKSHQDSRPSEDLLPATTSTRSGAQTSQSTNSDMPVKALSVLSPHTLKVLQGRDPESVKSILRRLSEYSPELQEVNISLLVDVLFETGAVH